MTRTAADIRREFIDFFVKKHAHTFVPGSPVVPHDDPTLMFTNAGMNQFKPIFLGTADPRSEFGRLKRAANSQPCIRAGGKHNDLDDVGHDTYHHTFFEMLGNWSFGDYFKKEAIAWAWELLTEVWGIDKRRLHATYFGGNAEQGLEPDHESRDLWKQIAGLPDDHIHPGNMKDNFWEMGDTGPCGPCSEVHIDLTPDLSGSKLVNAGDARVMEIWNLVFIQFNRGPDGKLSPLPAKHVDTGMGFERICSVVQGTESGRIGQVTNYDTDVFTPIFAAIQKLSGAPAYGGRLESADQNPDRKGAGNEAAPDREALMRDIAYRVIADHIRTLTFAISDGAVPDTGGRGYVLRRILRRAVRYGWQYLGLKEPFLCRLASTVIDVMGEAFPHLRKSPERVIEIIREEEESFARTLDRGIALFEQAAERSLATLDHNISAEDAFRLHDTYGFPVDLTEIMAQERGLGVDGQGFDRLMENARMRARSGDQVRDALQHLDRESIGRFGPTDDRLKYAITECSARVLAVASLEDGIVCDAGGIGVGERFALILDRTCFYGEQGGQVGDCGSFSTKSVNEETNDAQFRITDTHRLGEVVLHLGEIESGELIIGIGHEGMLRLDPRRRGTQRNHTATHLLNWALREVLDHDSTGTCLNQLQQKGSLVDPEKTRFDFSHNKALTQQETERIEALVNERIAAGLIVDTNENAPVAQKDAIKINGLRAVFGEKYPDEVRVVSIGIPVRDLLANPGNPEWRKYSIEFCGGTHVKNTREIEHFVITHEEAVAKGVRRIVGITGEAARKAVETGAALLKRALALKSATGDAFATGLHDLQRESNEASIRVVDRLHLRDVITELQTLAKKQQKESSAASGDALREHADRLLAGAEKRGGTTIVVAELPDLPMEQLKTIADMLKQRAGSAALLFGVRQTVEAKEEKQPGAGGPQDDQTQPRAAELQVKALLLAAVTDDLVKKGVKAGDWIKAVAPIVDGGGGGPPTMAQAGGKNPAKLADALIAGNQWILLKLPE